MAPRVAPLLTASIALVIVAACGGASAVAAPPAPSAAPMATPALSPRPAPTAVPAPAATPVPYSGNVDGGGTVPELTIEPVSAQAIRASITDPAAKAWRLVVAGVGLRAGDRWEIQVETGDVGPSITATEIRDGKVVDVMDLSGFADGTAAAGGCHGTLPVCLDSDGFRLPQNGDGTFSVRLAVTDPAIPLTVIGQTASWPGEPFILGPWTSTDPFPWGQG